MKTILIKYGIATGFCAVFGFVYELFAHGVYSNYMMFAFLIPLLLGGIPYVIRYFKKNTCLPSLSSRRLMAYGVSTLTIGSILSGVFEIYGTTSNYVVVYFVIGAILYFCGLLKCYIIF